MTTTTNTCGWLVEKVYNGPDYTEADMADPEWEPWHPDFPSDCYRIVPCGDVVDPDATGPFCTFHREPIEMSDLEFEDQVQHRSWS